MPQMSTILELSSQWRNPSDVTAILMIIGGDVVQKALAQSSGSWYVPVCFSFGWVAYAFTAFVNMIGDGRLMPEPDYPVKVFNLDSGYVRENKNWLIGRIMRDHVAAMSRKFTDTVDHGVRIIVYEAKHHKGSGFRYGKLHILGLTMMMAQFGVAAIPIALHNDWGSMLITAGGTILSLTCGCLPQWKVEKIPAKTDSDSTFALTSGNGTRDILVIKGLGQFMSLEKFATLDNPRKASTWQKLLPLEHRDTEVHPWAHTSFGLPYGFWITLIMCVSQSILWLLLLLTVAALKQNTWYMLAIGGLGMFQNGILAAMERSFEHRDMYLREIDSIVTHKVMDGIMDFHITHHVGNELRKEFFPGKARQAEDEWWDGNPVEDDLSYDLKRIKDGWPRPPPRSKLPPYEIPKGSPPLTPQLPPGALILPDLEQSPRWA